VRVQPQLGLVVLDKEILRQQHRTIFIERDGAWHGHGLRDRNAHRQDKHTRIVAMLVGKRNIFIKYACGIAP
jgi:hypothetical protein